MTAPVATLTVIVFAVARAADVITTLLALKEAGTREKNRTARWLAARLGWPAALIGKSAVFIALAWWMTATWPPSAPIVWAYSAASLWFAVSNARIWLRQRAKRKALVSPRNGSE